ncbi:hypothetical protein Ahy_B03g067354 [Arachis hypogaea]|uniref:Transposase MuDR plant domain-containing protein n=1 Tax=Arachis hypogaea TaxID=3818 RepID=A0A445A6J6_ARAHY|nr:hypothetical protein Ahy_B03g067354 [Arachis hypogaea]
MNNDNNEEFEATYEAGDEDENSDDGAPPLCSLDLDVMHAPEFSEYANIGVVDLEDTEFRIGMECSSRKLIIALIRSYTIFRGVDYVVYESELQTFYAKYKTYGCRCDWLIQASLI